MNLSFLVDGPLQGQTVTSRVPEVEGSILDIEVVDVGHSLGPVDRFAYRVVTTCLEPLPGTLRYVTQVAHRTE